MRRIDYPKLYKWSASRPKLTRAMRGLYVPMVVLVAASYALHVVLALWLGSLTVGLTLLAVSGCPFVAVSLLRYLIDAPRPYEVYDLSGLGLEVPRHKSGRSFPSRHTFSAFLIGTLLLPGVPSLGAVVLLVGICLATSRVLLGIHFIRDVVSGAVIGVIAGVLGALCIRLFC